MTIPTKESLLQLLQDKTYRPITFKELARELMIAKKERDAFKNLLRGLIKDGHITKIKGDR
ncbi:MAG TPA: hypothetical protein DHU69_06170 [Deltaproteobacteria bacterium]|nr:hypothetical protein [Deltaproteobacteria bacterium]HCY19330.1 hypothetical protein [Deltaproteobacteria bacterium]